MDNERQIRERLLAMRRELVTLQDIADKDDSIPFGIFLDFVEDITGEQT